MRGGSFFSRIFSRKKSLDDLDLDELTREKIRLKREESKIAERIDEAEREKAALFQQALATDSKRRRTVIARRIKEIDAAARHNEALSRQISKQIRVFDGLIRIKENKRFRERFNALDILKKMNLDELAHTLEEYAIDGELDDNKIDALLHTLEEGDSLTAAKEDPDVEAILAAIEETAEAASKGKEDAATEGLEKVNRILSMEKESEQKAAEPPEPA